MTAPVCVAPLSITSRRRIIEGSAREGIEGVRFSFAKLLTSLFFLHQEGQHSVLRLSTGRACRLVAPLRLVAGPTAADHLVGVVVGVAGRLEILRQQFGGSKRHRRAFGFPMSDHGLDVLGIQNASERRANTN